jgi:hypothetical protein
VCGVFCLSRPASSRTWLVRNQPRSAQAHEARGPVVLPDGRITRRFTSSAPAGFAASECRLNAVCESLPRPRVRWTLGAGAAPRPHFGATSGSATCGRGWRQGTRARGTGDKFPTLIFAAARDTRNKPGPHGACIAFFRCPNPSLCRSRPVRSFRASQTNESVCCADCRHCRDATQMRVSRPRAESSQFCGSR